MTIATLPDLPTNKAPGEQFPSADWNSSARVVNEAKVERINVRHHGASPTASTATNATAIGAAIAAAAAAGASVYWPAGDYPTGTSIPDLHTVRHEGPGVITRTGGVRFHVDPHGTQANTLYVAPAGATSSDGLSATQPTTFAAAFAALRNYGPVLDGNWNVTAAAGTYTGVLNATHDTPSRNRVVIRGPVAGHPNVPTAIIDGAGGVAYQHGIRTTGIGVRVDVRDLKFINYTTGAADTTRIGLSGESEVDLFTTNIHVTGASWCGVYAFGAIRARINGGILDGCRVGHMSNASHTTIADAICRNSIETGIAFTRGSQGHADDCFLEDSGVAGVLVSENSRVHTVACNFKRNPYAIQARTGGVWASATNIYNDGTLNAQTLANHQSFAYSGNVQEIDTAATYARVAFDRTFVSHTGTVATTVLATPYTLPAGRLKGVGKQLKVNVYGVITAGASSSLAVAVGGMTLTLPVPAASSALTFEFEATLLEVQGGYRMFGRLAQGLGGQRYGSASTGFSVDANSPVTVSATLVDATNTVNVYRTDVWVLG